MNTLTMLAVTVLAAEEPGKEPINTGPDFGKASPVGLLVIVLLLIGTFLLVRSMGRHLRGLPTSFEGESADPVAVDEGVVQDPAPDDPVEHVARTQDSGGQPPG